MIPISDEEKGLVIEALKDSAGQLEIESAMPEDMRELAAIEYVPMIETLKDMWQRLEAGELVIMDTKPRCMAALKEGQCEEYGRYMPFIQVNGPTGDPICRADTNPPLRLCETHATGDIDHYCPKELWDQIQGQVIRANGAIVKKDDARVWFLDTETGVPVPPPGVSIALPGN